MRSYKIVFTLCLILFTVLFVSCGNIFGNKKSYSNVRVLVKDNKSNPISGAIITTYPPSKEEITDNEGRAIIENIQVGEYRLVVRHSDGYIIEKIINLKADKDIDIDIIFFISNVKITVTIKDDLERPISGVVITTIPETTEIITNENGKGIIEIIAGELYTLSVRYPNQVTHRRYIKIWEDNNITTIDIVYRTKSPEMTILSLQSNDNKFSPPFIFSGMGSDKEDGELLGSCLVWYSSIDGELGYGRELVVESLSEGKHVITLVGTDSDQKKGEASVSLLVIHNLSESYFPISANSNWTYRHLEPEFTIINKYNETEVWKLNDISV